MAEPVFKPLPDKAYKLKTAVSEWWYVETWSADQSVLSAYDFGDGGQDEASSFAFVEYGSRYYVYDVTEKKFLASPRPPVYENSKKNVLTDDFACRFWEISFHDTGDADSPVYMTDQNGYIIGMDDYASVSACAENELGDHSKFSFVEASGFDEAARQEAIGILENILSVKVITSNPLPDKTYMVRTSGRGWWSTDGAKVTQTDDKAGAARFAFVERDSRLYLYSVADKKFVGGSLVPGAVTINNNESVLCDEDLSLLTAVTFNATENESFPVYFSDQNNFVFNLNGAHVYVNRWTRLDDGNQLAVIESDDFDEAVRQEAADLLAHYTPVGYVTAGFSDDKSYIVKTATGKWWGTDGTNLKAVDSEAEAARFAFVKYGSASYMYSVSDKKIVANSLSQDMIDGYNNPCVLVDESFAKAATVGLSMVGSTGYEVYLVTQEYFLFNTIEDGSVVICEKNGLSEGSKLLISEAGEFGDAERQEVVGKIDAYFSARGLTSEPSPDKTYVVKNAAGKWWGTDGTNVIAVADEAQAVRFAFVEYGSNLYMYSVADRKYLSHSLLSSEVNTENNECVLLDGCFSKIASVYFDESGEDFFPVRLVSSYDFCFGTNEEGKVLINRVTESNADNQLCVREATGFDEVARAQAVALLDAYFKAPTITSDPLPDKTYTIKTAGHGWWGTDGTKLIHVNDETQAARFAFVGKESQLYIYSVADRKFVASELKESDVSYYNNKGILVDDDLSKISAVTFNLSWDRDNPVYLTDQNGFYFNANGQGVIVINTHNSLNQGNKLTITQSADLDEADRQEAARLLENYTPVRYITSDPLPDKTYVVETLGRGWWGIDGGSVVAVTEKLQAARFAFVEYGGKLYVYSVADRKFVASSLKAINESNNNLVLEDVHLSKVATVNFNIVTEGRKQVYLKDGNNYLYKTNEEGNIVIGYDYGLDDGSKMYITEDAGFDETARTEAVAKLETFYSARGITSDPLPGKAYVVKTAGRGWWSTDGENVIAVTEEAQAARFAFVEYCSNLYMYSVADRKFVSAPFQGEEGSGTGNRCVLADKQLSMVSVLDFTETDEELYPVCLRDRSGNVLGTNEDGEVTIGSYDGLDVGNQLAILESADFDDTARAEAVALLEDYYHARGITSNPLPDKTYVIHTAGRGWLGTDGGNVIAVTEEAQAARFAFVKYDTNLYLYSVADKKFVSRSHFVSQIEGRNGYECILTDKYFSDLPSMRFDESSDNSFPVYLEEEIYGHVLEVSEGGEVLLNIDRITPHAGNQLAVVETSDFEEDAYTQAVALLDAYFKAPTITSDPLPGKVYVIRTSDRGWWSTAEEKLTHVLDEADAGRFAFVEYGSKLYLYSVADKKFVASSEEPSLVGIGNNEGILVDNDLSMISEVAFNETYDDDYPVYLTDQHGFYFNANGSGKVVINTYSTLNGGNMLSVTETADFDEAARAEAVALLEHYFVTGVPFVPQPGKIYMVKTAGRGWWGTDNGNVVAVAEEAQAARFAFVDYDGKCYMYSVADRKFVTRLQDPAESESYGSKCVLADADLVNISAVTFSVSEDDTAPVCLTDQDGFIFGTSEDGNVLVGRNNGWDEGNRLAVIEYADFDDGARMEAVAILDAYFVVPPVTIEPLPDKIYTIKTAGRGWWGTDGTKATHVSDEADAARFAFVKYNSKLYIYSVADKKFVASSEFSDNVDDRNNESQLVDADLSMISEVTFKETGNEDSPFYLTDQHGFVFNANNRGSIVINTWSIMDNGNQLAIVQAADFSDEERLEAIGLLEDYFNSSSFRPSFEKSYTVKTAGRGWWGTDGTKVISVADEADAAAFAFVEYLSRLYLYSVDEGKFVAGSELPADVTDSNNGNILVDTDLSKIAQVTLNAVANENGQIYLTNQDGFVFNTTEDGRVVINTAKELNEGNRLLLSESGNFDSNDRSVAVGILENNLYPTIVSNPRPDKVYAIKTLGRNWWGSNGAKLTDRAEARKAVGMAFVEYKSRLFLYSVTDKKFVGRDGDTAILLDALDEGITYISEVSLNASGNADYPVYLTDQNGFCFNANGMGSVVINSWKTLDEGNQLLIAETVDFDDIARQEALDALEAYFSDYSEITYHCSYNGKIFKTVSELVRNGNFYPDAPDLSYQYGSYDSGLPEGFVSEDAAYTLNYVVTDAPVVATTITDGKFADDTEWYILRFDDDHTWCVVPDENGDISHSGTFDDLLEDKSLFCFVGDPLNGYAVYNKVLGAGTALKTNAEKPGFGQPEDALWMIHRGWYMTIVRRGTESSWKLNQETQEIGYDLSGMPVSLADRMNAAFLVVENLSESVEGKIGGYDSKTFAALWDEAGENGMTEVFKSLYRKASVPAADKYYRISCAGEDNVMMGHSVTGEYANVTEGQNTNVGQIYQFVPFRKNMYYLKNVNTGKYVGNISSLKYARLVDEDEAALFRLDYLGEGWNHIAQGSSYICCGNSEEEYRIVASSNSQNNYTLWSITEATDIVVNMNVVGGESVATLHLPFNATVKEGTTTVNVGTFNEDKSRLMLSSVDGVPANTGVILHSADAATSVTLNIGGEVETAVSDLLGTNVSIALTDDNRADYLVFGLSAGELGFYRPSASIVQLAANKAYLSAAGLSAVRLMLGNDPTGISHVTVTDNDAPVYDLSGRRVKDVVKGGIYLRNGRKFIVK